MPMNTNSLNVKIVASPNEAPDYKGMEGYFGADLEQVVVVRNGTQGGRSTVDLITRDEEGNKYVTMLTGRLITALAQVIGDEP